MAWQGRGGRIAIAGIISGLALCAPSVASANPTCSLDTAEHELTVLIDGHGARFEYYMSQIYILGLDVDGQTICAGGTPTSANVDTVRIRKAQGFTRASELLLFASPELFAPGFSNAGDTGPDDAPEIEWNVQMGTARGDRFELQGADSATSVLRWGSKGLNINAPEEPLAPDADLRVKGADLIFDQPGADGTLDVDGSGGEGLGDPLAAPFDLGTDRNYGLVGGIHDDSLVGGDGDDEIKGWQGADTMAGGRGDDWINAKDGAADASISCGPGHDRAQLDESDPDPTGCEHVKVVPVAPPRARP